MKRLVSTFARLSGENAGRAGLNASPRLARGRIRFFVLSLLTLAMAGCEDPGVPVTGANAEAPDAAFAQSETAVTAAVSGGKTILVVGYNDETDGTSTILYTPTSRTILAGASLMGWSYSIDRGKSWIYGGRVKPPEDWAVLWGDPAITTSQGSKKYVFMSQLAIPSSKMPNAGISGSVVISGANSYIGGACIARSTDGGKAFEAYQCVSNKVKNGVPNSEKGHFYDGGSMASSQDGEIYAAFIDITTSRIDVWRSPDENGTFEMLPTPFPEFDVMSHPRIRVDQGSGALYAAALANNSQVYINRYKNGSWGKPVVASNTAAHYPCVAFEPNACTVSSKLSLRTGPQFSFDIGAVSSPQGVDAIRFLYTQKDAETGRLYVTGSMCTRSLNPGCWPAPQWGTTPGNLNTPGDQFNPTVAAWRGFIGFQPIWKAAYWDRDGSPANTVTLKQGNLAYLPNGTRIFVPFNLIKDIPVCPDLRGYWGDYDDLAHVGFKEDSTTAQFLRTTSDSSLGCPTRWQYISNHLHIRSAVFQ